MYVATRKRRLTFILQHYWPDDIRSELNDENTIFLEKGTLFFFNQKTLLKCS